ncbi:hypothetical protein EDB89DRAFT_2235483 [Lactarius sanguifluus]|nr:hypothetical protein EDB89DRAFT_2235483 [Lactarius sanguifluus]
MHGSRRGGLMNTRANSGSKELGLSGGLGPHRAGFGNVGTAVRAPVWASAAPAVVREAEPIDITMDGVGEGSEGPMGASAVTTDMFQLFLHRNRTPFAFRTT